MLPCDFYFSSQGVTFPSTFHRCLLRPTTHSRHSQELSFCVFHSLESKRTRMGVGRVLLLPPKGEVPQLQHMWG